MKLVCTECQRENESERIYCHDCGSRLDRSAVAKEEAKQETPEETQRRLKSMFDPKGAHLRQNFFQGAKLVLAAGVAAALVQMVRTPDLPALAKTTELPASINLDLENMAMDPRVGALRYSDEQVNAYLAYALRNKQAAVSKFLKFERVVVGFEQGSCEVTLVRSLLGLPVSTSASLAARTENGSIVAENRGGAIGRMPVHPSLMQFGDVLFGGLRGALERERKSIAKLGVVEFHPKAILFAPKRA